MIVLPLFWDQYDNAQRVRKLGLGVRLDTYAFEDEELRRAVDRLVADDNLRARMDAVGKAVRAEDGLGRAADLIESIARAPRSDGSDGLSVPPNVANGAATAMIPMIHRSDWRM